LDLTNWYRDRWQAVMSAMMNLQVLAPWSCLVLIYASETWVLSKQDEHIATFERKILRTVYGPVKQGNEL
jgi:hypothetical protein